MAQNKHDENVTVMIARHFTDIDLSDSAIRELITTACSRFGLSSATVSIAVVGDAEITDVNRQFLNSDRTTDCISFDLSDDEAGPDAARLFDLVVNGQKALRQAEQRGHSPEAELALYVIHGMLHNLGFDDATDRDAAKMHAVEDDILQQLGYGRVYHNDIDSSSGNVMPN
jgi:probable rRNA maturation factor